MENEEGKVAYFNGKFVPQSEARLSVYDRGFRRGECVYDTSRTVNKIKIFRLKDHIERLYRSLRYACIDLDISPKEMERIHMEVARRNAHFLGENDEHWIHVFVTSGIAPSSSLPTRKKKEQPTVIIHCTRIDYAHRAKLYKTGTHMVVSSIRHIPPECLDMKVKNTNRLHMRLATLEAKRVDPDAYALMLDVNGNVAESTDANIFIVSQGELITPTTRNALGGISRQVVLELAGKLNIPAFERDIQLYDVFNADEAFQTGSSYCMLPISRINGKHIWKKIPGPITKRLLDAYSEEIGLDIVGQLLSHLKE